MTAPDPAGRPAARPAGREFAVMLAALVVAAGGLLFACGQAWATVTVRAPGLPRTVTAIDGRTLVPVAFALGLAALAGTLGLLATRGWGRRVVAVLVALCGLGAGYAATAGALGERRAVLAAAGITGPTPPGASVTVDPAAWPWLAVAASVLVAVAGVVAVVRAPRWPAMGRRYEPPATAGASAVPEEPSDADLWKALDRGEDPTTR